MPWYWPFAAQSKWELDGKLSASGMRELAARIAPMLGPGGGVLIAPTLMLTTAHAVPMGREHAAKHPYYQFTGLYNDVALCRLTQPIKLKEYPSLLPEYWEQDEVIPTLGYLRGHVSVEDYAACDSEPARLYFNRPAMKTRRTWWRQAYTGDSNSPRFHLHRGKLYLISLYSSAGSPTQPSIGPRITRELVAELRGLL